MLDQNNVPSGSEDALQRYRRILGEMEREGFKYAVPPINPPAQSNVANLNQYSSNAPTRPAVASTAAGAAQMSSQPAGPAASVSGEQEATRLMSQPPVPAAGINDQNAPTRLMAGSATSAAPVTRPTPGNPAQSGSGWDSTRPAVAAAQPVSPPAPVPSPAAVPQASASAAVKPIQAGKKNPAKKKPAKAAPRTWRDNMSCLARLTFFGLLLGAVMAVCLLIGGFYWYYSIASELPDISDIRQNAAQFETTRIYDRNGNVLYEILDPNAGRRTYVPLSKISPYLVAATIATEDQAFYSHPGFDIFGIVRAVYQNYQAGEIASGASTITQQLARNLVFTPEERSEQSYTRKIREAVLAAEITRRYTKDEILELYLNENYYGNLSYGIQAAAETYFGTSADKLTFGQAAFLAGLPQAPSVYDVFTNPDATFDRLQDVLTLTYEASQQDGCIYVSNSPERVCVDPLMVVEANNEIRNTSFVRRADEMRFPHWVTYVRSLLEAQYDPQTIYRSGFQVYTTLDPTIQEQAEQTVKNQVASLADKNAQDGALVAIRPTTGEILAMVGSADFYNEAISGQVNMAISPRQPGSSIKPLTYVAAFEKGWTPGTLIWDVPSEFSPSGVPDEYSEPYVPVNYDGRFHGPVTLRSALANSYNIPAVKALQFVGIKDDPTTSFPDGFLNFARRLGISTLNRDDYGLSLTLGGGEVTLLEMTDAFATFANSGRRIAPVAITRITDYNGAVVYEHQPTSGEQVVREEHAYLISDILSDNEARSPAFGRNSVLRLPFQAAAKTGTTNDFRDNWTLGYTPDLAVGVWVGNADYTPMQNTSGLTGAAPIWSEFMQWAVPQVSGGNPTPFTRPNAVLEQVICAISGTQPSQWCPEQRVEIFAVDQPPLPADKDLWQKPVLDTWTALLASAACPDFTDSRLTLAVDDPWGKRWVNKDGQGRDWAESMGFDIPVNFAPARECRSDDPRPRLAFVSPIDNSTINTSPLDIYAVVDATAWFDYATLEYGRGDEPMEWSLLQEIRSPVPQPQVIYTWDLRDIEPGRITLRLKLHSTEDTYAETFLHLDIQVPTPTPLPTETPVPTETPFPTWTPLPVWPTFPPPFDTPTPEFPKPTPGPSPTP